MENKILLKLTRLFFLVLTLGLSMGVSLNALGQATVTTDKDDYSPGMYVTITGTGWQPGETVTLHIAEDPKPATCILPHDMTAVADVNGNIYNDQMLIKENHLGVTFTLTAIGQFSGFTATRIFTDAGLSNVVVTETSFCPGNPVTINFNSTSAGAGGAFKNGNIFTAQLSNSSGNFSSPVSIGTISFDGGGNNNSHSITGTIPIIIAAGTGYRIRVVSSDPVTNSPSNDVDLTINSAPSTPGVITQPAIKCAASTGNTFSIAPVTGATSYTWSVTGTGWAVTAGGSTPSATITIGSGVGTVSVTATNSCGTSAASTTGNITPSIAPATPGAISRPANECAGSTGNIYSIAPVNGATSYTWSVTGTGWAVTAGGTTSSATITIGSGVGTVSVTATNACGTSAASTTGNITPSTAPTVSATNLPAAGTISNTLGLCSASVPFGSNVTASGTPAPTLVYSLISGDFDNPITSPYVFPVGETTVYVRASNSCGSDDASFTVTVTDDELPVISAGSDITQTADAGECSAVVSIVDATATDNCSVGAVTGTRSDALALTAPYPVGVTTITWTVTDVNGNAAVAVEQTVTVTNNVPSNLIITAPINPQPIGTSISVSATFVDENIEKATWTAFDGNTVIQSVTIPATGNSSSYTFTNLPAGVYTIILEVEDYCGKVAQEQFEFVTIYDPNGGFVTGGGWIYSKPGDLKTDPTAEGKANFGFVAKYKTGKNQVDQVEGNTNFQFKEGDFHFKSTSHESMSLVISGAKATYRGVGTVNGIGTHKFMVTVIDGDLRGTTDMFRIRVWAHNSSSDVIYDNEYSLAENAEATTLLGGGSIVIHKPAAKGNKRVSTELITVAWNTPVETIKQKVDQMSAGWFESRKLAMTLDAGAYDPLTPGIYELKADVVENEFFTLDEPISIQVLVQDKPMALDITLENGNLSRELRAGEVLGYLNTIDPVDNIHTYQIEEHEDLILDGDKLIWRGTTVPAQLRLTVFSTDRAGQTISREIKLSREMKPGEFFLYPNPAHRETNVMVDMDVDATVAIRIYDAIGRLVVENEAYRESSFTQTFNLDGLAAGFYNVQVKVGDMVMTKRLIIK